MASPLTPNVALANLQATALTARCHNALFRLKQLKSLHDALRNNSSTLKDALKQDTSVSDAEAATEVALTLDLVREHYSSIDVKKELEQEYRVKNGQSAADEREPWGVTFIEPQRNHTPLFSAVTALSAALAGGNCVALKLENNLRALPSLLRKVLTEALESDTLAIVSSDPSSEALSGCLQVFQESHFSQSTYSQLVSPKGKVVAVIDRTADLASAAEQLVTARFAFGGTSPYAPDLVLVNEFIKKEFLEHVIRHSIPFLSGSSDVVVNGPSKPSSKSGQKPTSRISDVLTSLQKSKSWSSNVITQGANGAIVELSNLSALPPKSDHSVFSMASITSLEHAINLIDNDADAQDTLLAAYHFGTPSTGKYLSQFINADVSSVNHIPVRILLGPAAPAFYAIDVEKRYTAEQFTRSSPTFIAPPKSQKSFAKLISGKDSRQAAAELLANATQEIKEKKRAEWIAIGYFEQGIFIGLGLYGIPLLSIVGASVFFGVRAGLRRWAFI